MLAGFALGALTYFPIFAGLTHFANPKLEAAVRGSNPLAGTQYCKLKCQAFYSVQCDAVPERDLWSKRQRTPAATDEL
jgi:hypothetical protein